MVRCRTGLGCLVLITAVGLSEALPAAAQQREPTTESPRRERAKKKETPQRTERTSRTERATPRTERSRSTSRSTGRSTGRTSKTEPSRSTGRSTSRSTGRSTGRSTEPARTRRPATTPTRPTPQQDRVIRVDPSTDGSRTRDRGYDRDRDRDRGYDRDRGRDRDVTSRRPAPRSTQATYRRPDRARPDRTYVYYNDRRKQVNVNIINMGGARYYPHHHHRHRPRGPKGVYVRIDVNWPWTYRHKRHWAPRYRYRQVVYVDAGRRDARIDVETTYRHQVRYATRDYAEVDIYIERIAFFEDGYYLGEVHRIPRELSRIRATLYRNGRVDYDRDVFVVGDARAGFELIAARGIGGPVLSSYGRGTLLSAGYVDLRTERVVPVRYSRLYDPYRYGGYVPVSLLPDERELLWDYGPASVSAYSYDDGCYDDVHYYGAYDDDPYYRDDDVVVYDRSVRDGVRNGGATYEGSPSRPSTMGAESLEAMLVPIRHETDQTYRLDQGQEVRVRREMTLQRID